MTKPYKRSFPFPNDPGTYLTSVVVDKEDFEEFMNVVSSTTKLDEKGVKACLNAGHIPLICRGTKTDMLFDYFDVESKYMTVCIRGTAVQILASMLESREVEL